MRARSPSWSVSGYPILSQPPATELGVTQRPCFLVLQTAFPPTMSSDAIRGLACLMLTLCVACRNESDRSTADSAAPAPRSRSANVSVLARPAPPDRWAVSERGIGPVRVNQSTGEVGSALGESFTLRVPTDYPAGSPRCAIAKWPSNPLGVLVVIENAVVTRVEVDSGSVRTEDGVGIGDPVEQATEAAARRGWTVEDLGAVTTNARTLLVAPPDGANAERLGMVFDVSTTGRIDAYRAGRLGAIMRAASCDD